MFQDGFWRGMLWELANINFYLQNPKPQRIGGIKLRLSMMDDEEIGSRIFAPLWGRKSMEKRVRRPKGEQRGSGVLYEAPHTLNSRLRPRTPLVRGREDLSFASGLPQISGSISWEGRYLGVPEHRGAVGCSLWFRKRWWQHGWRRK